MKQYYVWQHSHCLICLEPTPNGYNERRWSMHRWSRPLERLTPHQADRRVSRLWADLKFPGATSTPLEARYG